MAESIPHCSTAALAPIIEALMSRPGQGRGQLTAPLHRYLRSDLPGDAWHPESDRLELAAGLSASLTTHLGLGRTWAYMGRLWSRRSLGDIKLGLPRGEAGHKLHQVLVAGNPRLTLARLTGMWSSFHNTGEIRVDFSDKHQVRVQLMNFRAATPEALGLVGGVLAEALWMAGAERLAMHTQAEFAKQGAVWTLSWQERPDDAAMASHEWLDESTEEIDVELEAATESTVEPVPPRASAPPELAAFEA